MHEIHTPDDVYGCFIRAASNGRGIASGVETVRRYSGQRRQGVQP